MARNMAIEQIIAFEDFLVTAETSAYRVNKPKAKASNKRQTGETEHYEQDSLFPVAPQ